MKRVEVTWVDSQGDDGRWGDRTENDWDDWYMKMIQKSVGYVLHEDDRMIAITSSYQPHGDQAMFILTIPRVAISDIKVLR